MSSAPKAERGRVIVTGASKGIGAAIAGELIARGYAVLSLSRSGGGQHGEQVACDMTDEGNVREVFASIAGAGPISGLVSNAGVHLSSPTASLPTEEYRQVMSLNADAVMIAAREVHPHLVAAGGGTIVNIGSFFDKIGVPANLAYCASKAAVAAMTRCMASEWAPDGIRVMNVAPGYVETNLNRDFLAQESVQKWLAKRVPMGRAGKADEVARFVASLFSEDIAYLTGETVYIDGGHGMNL
ncbi:SDR family NAD(P)-dependent oxidoreductase [Hwanghaeella sp.]|uniref:SDR family NAD(P)-dependent oxidoreductase n=1 Tax=Hwanghaeella sp. TaxID=2605943 RepID=UPI003CCBB91C